MTNLFEYESRARRLKREGFVAFEIFWLAQHDIDTSGMRVWRRERKSHFEDYKRQPHFTAEFEPIEDYSRESYTETIRLWYESNGYLFRNGNPNPFAAYEAFKWRTDQPDTPQRKRPTLPKNFTSGKEATQTRPKRTPVSSYARAKGRE